MFFVSHYHCPVHRVRPNDVNEIYNILCSGPVVPCLTGVEAAKEGDGIETGESRVEDGVD